jgi:hypothetical protein
LASSWTDTYDYPSTLAWANERSGISSDKVWTTNSGSGGPETSLETDSVTDPESPPMPPQPDDLGHLLDAIVTFIRRFVVLSEHQHDAIALWVIHTHAFLAADTTAYINITSSEKRSGKTRLLETLELLVARPWFTGHVTAAVLARKVDAEFPTLLLDESDATFKGDKDYAETLRGMLNSGYRRGGKCSICVGQGANLGYKDLSTFCPKAIAGIGQLPGTVADRSITIRLKRRAGGEPVERFRRRKLEPETTALRNRIASCVPGLIDSLKNAEPTLPDELNDRAADCWEPLLAIADAAGADWPQRAREAAVSLSAGAVVEDESLGIKLLRDIRDVFEWKDKESLSSKALIYALNELDESPWGDLHGRTLDARGLAARLKGYDIHPRGIRVGTNTPKGYQKTDFIDSWSRYLPPNDQSSATSATADSGDAQNGTAFLPPQPPSGSGNVAAELQVQRSHDVADVADKMPNQDESRNSDKGNDLNNLDSVRHSVPTEVTK